MHGVTVYHVYRQVLGIDATAAQTLASLAMVLRRMGVELVITRVTDKSIRRLLIAHKIISARDSGGSDAAGITAGTAEGSGSSPGAVASSTTGEVLAGCSSDLEQPLLEQQQQQGEAAVESDEDYGYCRVFDTLNEGAKYAEDR